MFVPNTKVPDEFAAITFGNLSMRQSMPSLKVCPPVT